MAVFRSSLDQPRYICELVLVLRVGCIPTLRPSLTQPRYIRELVLVLRVCYIPTFRPSLDQPRYIRELVLVLRVGCIPTLRPSLIQPRYIRELWSAIFKPSRNFWIFRNRIKISLSIYYFRQFKSRILTPFWKTNYFISKLINISKLTKTIKKNVCLWGHPVSPSPWSWAYIPWWSKGVYILCSRC